LCYFVYERRKEKGKRKKEKGKRRKEKGERKKEKGKSELKSPPWRGKGWV